MEEIKKVSKQVIVIRKDLRNSKGEKIRTGKIVSQGSHSVLKAVLDTGSVNPLYPHLCKTENCRTDLHEGECNQCGETYNEIGKEIIISAKKGSALYDWLFNEMFTKITVYVNSEAELLEVYNKAKEKGLICSLITDAGLTEFNGVPTKTAVAIGPCWAEEVDGITGNLPLL